MERKISKLKKKRNTSIGHVTWAKFKKNKLSMFGLSVISISLLVFILGYLITPDSSPNCNDQKPELQMKPPGFAIKMLKIKKDETTEENNFLSTMLFGEKSSYSFHTFVDYSFSGNDIVIEEFTGNTPNFGKKIRYNLFDVVFDINSNPLKLNDEKNGKFEFFDSETGQNRSLSVRELQTKILKNHLVEKKYYLGTDSLGRDLLSRMIIGTRVSLSVGFIAVFISLLIGVSLGALAGYFRGKTDALISWAINVVWSIPTLLLVIAITLVLGKGFWQVFVAVGLTMWVEVARLVRGQVLSLREKEYVEAGNSLGFKNSRIILKHILPNVMGPVIVISASNFASAILTEAGLSFLGIGAQPPMSSWGKMINDHRKYIFSPDAFYSAFIPGLAIMLLVLAFMLIGNGLRDALDSKSLDGKPIMGN